MAPTQTQNYILRVADEVPHAAEAISPDMEKLFAVTAGYWFKPAFMKRVWESALKSNPERPNEIAERVSKSYMAGIALDSAGKSQVLRALHYLYEKNFPKSEVEEDGHNLRILCDKRKIALALLFYGQFDAYTAFTDRYFSDTSTERHDLVERVRAV